jgi:hypothetical protein
MEYCFLGEPWTDLKETFLKYVSPSEASVFKQGIEDFGGVDNEELNDIMQLNVIRKP